MEIHVVRHTPIDMDKNKCYGRLDVPLAASFKKDVLLIKDKLDSNYHQIYTSPTSRCTKLAKAISSKNVISDSRLLELNFGDWEGMFWNDIDNEDLNNWMLDFVNNSPTNGETLKSMFSRISNFINELRNHSFDKVLIITHSGVIRCFWAYFLEIPLQNIFRLPVGFGEVFKFNLGTEKQYDLIKQLK